MVVPLRSGYRVTCNSSVLRRHQLFGLEVVEAAIRLVEWSERNIAGRVIPRISRKSISVCVHLHATEVIDQDIALDQQPA